MPGTNYRKIHTWSKLPLRFSQRKFGACQQLNRKLTTSKSSLCSQTQNRTGKKKILTFIYFTIHIYLAFHAAVVRQDPIPGSSTTTRQQDWSPVFKFVSAVANSSLLLYHHTV